jgi:5,10-methylenetetrahydromethanopterin reductase
MRLGTLLLTDNWPNKSMSQVIRYIQHLETLGFDNVWMANIFDYDAITTMAIAGQATEHIGLGTAVVPTYPRHPMIMAQQALTAASACDDRFTLGIGLSHQVMIEQLMGLEYQRPAQHMREYLQVLMPLLRGEPVQHEGSLFRVQGELKIDRPVPVPTVIGALGPRMLKVAGALADGTITWMTGPKTLRDHIIPTICDAAARASRPSPRVVAGLPVALCSNIDRARATLNENLALYSVLPSYRAMLDREGVAGAGDIALLGDEDALRAEILQLKDMGVTDLNAALMDVEPDSQQRTLQFLAALKPELQ